MPCCGVPENNFVECVVDTGNRMRGETSAVARLERRGIFLMVSCSNWVQPACNMSKSRFLNIMLYALTALDALQSAQDAGEDRKIQHLEKLRSPM